ncbi:hypothetical protein ZWY2020_013750 [Hordeum vulgare]|nr:hypothetical protein ZWY2020_013750 [Hordeum vulgare]
MPSHHGVPLGKEQAAPNLPSPSAAAPGLAADASVPGHLLRAPPAPHGADPPPSPASPLSLVGGVGSLPPSPRPQLPAAGFRDILP